MDLVSFGGSGGFAVSISPGESELFSSISFFLSLSLPLPAQFTSLSPHAPSPLPWPWARGGGGSSLLAGTQHDLGDKADDGGGRLVGVKLSKEVAGVVRGASLFPGHKTEEPAGAGDR